MGGQDYAPPGFLPVVTGNVINPKGVADILFPFLLVLAETWQDVDLVEFRVNCGSLSKTCHRHCPEVEGKNFKDQEEAKGTNARSYNGRVNTTTQVLSCFFSALLFITNDLGVYFSWVVYEKDRNKEMRQTAGDIAAEITYPFLSPSWCHQRWPQRGLHPHHSWRSRSGMSLTSGLQTHTGIGFSVSEAMTTGFMMGPNY